MSQNLPPAIADTECILRLGDLDFSEHVVVVAAVAWLELPFGRRGFASVGASSAPLQDNCT